MDIHQKKIHAVMEQVNQVILGKETEVREMMLAFLADGHILLEDIPGVGKTTLTLAFSRAMELDYKRVQFTPDVMPSDLTGFSVYRRDKEKFVYQPGVVFCIPENPSGADCCRFSQQPAHADGISRSPVAGGYGQSGAGGQWTGRWNGRNPSAAGIPSGRFLASYSLEPERPNRKALD